MGFGYTETSIVSSIDGSLPGATEALDTGFSTQHNSHIVIEPVNLESLATSSYHDANGETATECSSRFLETSGDNITVNHDTGSFDDGYDQGCENVDNATSLEMLEDNITINHDSGSKDSHDRGCVKFGCENGDNETRFLETFGGNITVNHDSTSSNTHDKLIQFHFLLQS